MNFLVFLLVISNLPYIGQRHCKCCILSEKTNIRIFISHLIFFLIILQISTTDFPSSVGFPALQNVKSKVDAAIVTLLKKAHAVQFGKTNVPEMAAR